MRCTRILPLVTVPQKIKSSSIILFARFTTSRASIVRSPGANDSLVSKRTVAIIVPLHSAFTSRSPSGSIAASTVVVCDAAPVDATVGVSVVVVVDVGLGVALVVPLVVCGVV